MILSPFLLPFPIREPLATNSILSAYACTDPAHMHLSVSFSFHQGLPRRRLLLFRRVWVPFVPPITRYVLSCTYTFL